MHVNTIRVQGDPSFEAEETPGRKRTYYKNQQVRVRNVVIHCTLTRRLHNVQNHPTWMNSATKGEEHFRAHEKDAYSTVFQKQRPS
jgi:hypothetical protein